MSDDDPRRFPTTAWSIVLDARQGSETERRAALERFARHYWRPVYYFLRVRGYGADVAQDYAQGFFLKFFERDWLVRADAERGKFRTYVLMTLKGYLSDLSPQRGPRQPHFESAMRSLPLALSDEERSFEPAIDETPERLFMRSWAESLVAIVGARLETDMRLQGRNRWFEAFQRCYIVNDEESSTQEEIARSLQMTREQFRHAVRQVRRRYSELLREEVSGQVDRESDVEGELHELLKLLGPSG